MLHKKLSFFHSRDGGEYIEFTSARVAHYLPLLPIHSQEKAVEDKGLTPANVPHYLPISNTFKRRQLKTKG